MPINNVTIITMDNITNIANSTGVAEFTVKANHIMFDGYGFFALLLAGWAIMFFSMQQRDEQVLHNLMYSGAIVSVVSFFFRAVEISVLGVKMGLLTDKLLWFFPLITLCIATVLWLTRD